MDATAWVAVAGILGTLIAPLLAEWMRRESTRRGHLLERRVAAYADLLRVTGRLANAALSYAERPLTELDRADHEELERLISVVRVVGAPVVRELVIVLAHHANDFHDIREAGRTHAREVSKVTGRDGTAGVDHQMAAAAVTRQLVDLYEQLEVAMRDDLRT